MLKKGFPFLIIGIFILSCGFYFFSRNPEAYVERAFKQFQENDFPQIEKTLEVLERDFPTYPSALYRGYVAQGKGNWHVADRYFQEVMNGSYKEVLWHELYLGRAINAYFLGRDEEFLSLLQQAEELAPNAPDLLFFQGLRYYLAGSYSAALELWALPISSPSHWATAVLQRIFFTHWLEIHIAHCLIEEGDLGGGQQILERERRILGEAGDPLEELAALFLGLASLKEARLFPVEERECVYKLAHFYFEQAAGHGSYSLEPIQGELVTALSALNPSALPVLAFQKNSGAAFTREKQRVIVATQQEAQYIFSTSSPSSWGLTFISLLEKWNALDALEPIADCILAELRDSSKALAMDLHPENHAAFQQLLLDKLVKEASNCISKGDAETLFNYWACIENLSSSPQDVAHQLCAQITQEMFRTFHYDTDTLSRTSRYLTFWKHLEKDPSSHVQLANCLIGHGEMLWKRESQEKKGTRLMEIALSLVSEPERSPLLKTIENFLTTLYRDAEQANMVRRLSLIYDALAYFHLGQQTLTSPTMLANHLADADYLFRARHYGAALTHAEWVLKFEPTNEEALRLCGLSSFYLGDFSKAAMVLNQLTSPDETSHKALILSHAFHSAPQEHHLAQHNPDDEM